MSLQHWIRPLIAATLCSWLAACGTETSDTDSSSSTGTSSGTGSDAGTGTGSTDPEAFELIGTWADNFGSPAEVVTQTTWAAKTIVEFHNDTNWMIAQLPADDQYNPSKFERTTWTEVSGGVFYACTVAYGLSTADEARAQTQQPDASDPATTGCGTFPWTKYTRQ